MAHNFCPGRKECFTALDDEKRAEVRAKYNLKKY